MDRPPLCEPHRQIHLLITYELCWEDRRAQLRSCHDIVKNCHATVKRCGVRNEGLEDYLQSWAEGVKASTV
jgi:hypothetical protein